jgi:hypothetical protein
VEASVCTASPPAESPVAPTARHACTNGSAFTHAIATGNLSAAIAVSATMKIPAIDLIHKLRSAQDEWLELQTRKIQTLYSLHKEKQNESQS